LKLCWCRDKTFEMRIVVGMKLIIPRVFCLQGTAESFGSKGPQNIRSSNVCVGASLTGGVSL